MYPLNGRRWRHDGAERQRKHQDAEHAAPDRAGRSASGGKVYELAARICELRKAGWPILTVKHEDWKLARYMLIGARKEAAGNER